MLLGLRGQKQKAIRTITSQVPVDLDLTYYPDPYSKDSTLNIWNMADQGRSAKNSYQRHRAAKYRDIKKKKRLRL